MTTPNMNERSFEEWWESNSIRVLDSQQASYAKKAWQEQEAFYAPQIEKLQAENAEWEATFELFDNAQARAIAEWRKQDPEGRRFKLPDMKDLTLWLITTLVEERQQLYVEEEFHACTKDDRKQLEQQLNQLKTACKAKDEALKEAKFLPAHGVGMIGGSGAGKENEERNLKEVKRILALIDDALCSTGSSLLAELEKAKEVVEASRNLVKVVCEDHYFDSEKSQKAVRHLADVLYDYNALSASEGKKEAGK